MAKQKRIICNQDLKQFAEGVIAHAKNGDRAVMRQIIDGPVLEVVYSDIPLDGLGYKKIMQHQPECLFGVYSTKIRVADLISDLSFKGDITND